MPRSKSPKPSPFTKHTDWRRLFLAKSAENTALARELRLRMDYELVLAERIVALEHRLGATPDA